MLYYKKGFEYFAFETYEDLKNYCANNEKDKISNYSEIKMNVFDKNTNKFNKSSG